MARGLVHEIRFAFDNRNFPQDIGVSMDSKKGQVDILFGDKTYVSEYCYRGELEDTIRDLVNQKYESTVRKFYKMVEEDEDYRGNSPELGRNELRAELRKKTKGIFNLTEGHTIDE